MTKIDVFARYKNYDKQYCWQYSKRIENLEEDIKNLGLTEEHINKLRVKDFVFEYVDKSDSKTCKLIKEFIERHEYLSCMPNRPTHRFIVKLRGKNAIAGAIIMATPNAFSYILGKENKDLEKLISRGACISWAPKNLNSYLVMSSIRWMVKNTQFRVFSAYSDPEAKELGTIYQACNFFILGQNHGSIKQYLDPLKPQKGWFSDREFRKKSKYAQYAKNIGIMKEEWNKYMNKYSPNWPIIPSNIILDIKNEEEKYRNSCVFREVKPKHKYCYILGKDKKETKTLVELFNKINPKLYNNRFNYPKIRGL